MNYELSATNITDTTASIVVEALTSTFGGTYTLAVSAGSTTVFTDSIVDPGMDAGDTVTTPLTGLTANTTYSVTFAEVGNDVADPITFTTKKTGYDEPRTATQEQWDDLASRVKQTPIITMTTVDPGEGATIGENEFIAVYSAS